MTYKNTRSTSGVPACHLRRKRQKGITILEITIAVAIFAAVALESTAVLLRTSSLDQDIKERSIASRVALSRIEEIKSYDVGSLANLAARLNEPSEATFAVTSLKARRVGPNFPGSASGVVTVDSSNPAILRVTVTITWGDRTGETRRCTLSTLFIEIES